MVRATERLRAVGDVAGAPMANATAAKTLAFQVRKSLAEQGIPKGREPRPEDGSPIAPDRRHRAVHRRYRWRLTGQQRFASASARRLSTLYGAIQVGCSGSSRAVVS